MLSRVSRIPSMTVHIKKIAVILADPDNAAWIFNSAPFPVVQRPPSIGDMYLLEAERPYLHHIQDARYSVLTRKFNRTFKGFFGTKEAPKRRRQ